MTRLVHTKQVVEYTRKKTMFDLIIPDIHGRTFWKKAIKKTAEKDIDKIVFLGDYLDPYPFEKISTNKAIENFKEILEFADTHENVVMLLGNHDIHYFYNPCESGRKDIEHKEIIRELFMKNWDFFNVAHCEGVVNEKADHILYSHAGITKGYANTLEKIGLLDREHFDPYLFVKDINDAVMDKDNPLHSKAMQSLAYVSFYRGGDCLNGSLVWADICEHSQSDPVFPRVFQLHGHTYVKKPVVFSWNIDLDTGGTAYLLNKDDGQVTSA